MIRDLRTILDGWAYEPGRISCRRIIGRDGREKLQTRIDLGVVQLECTGRPDGQRPGGYESLLDLQEQRLREHGAAHGGDQDFVLSPETCRQLRHEAHLYYQRYLAEFVLEDFAAVARDTGRNLRVIDLCTRYAASAQDRQLLRPQRAYVIMMHTRARAQLALAAGRPEAALEVVRSGIREILRPQVASEAGAGPHELAETLCHGPCEPATEDDGDASPAADAAGDETSTELEALQALRREILQSLPDTAPLKLQARLEAALTAEDYEEAARLRDQLREQTPPPGAAARSRTPDPAADQSNSAIPARGRAKKPR